MNINDDMNMWASTYKTDIPNANGRIYPKEVFKAALEEYWKNNKPIFGCIGQKMPIPVGVPLDEVSHVITEDNVIETKDGFYIRAKILDTPQGKVLKNMLEDKCPPLKFAICGTGNITEDHKINNLRIQSIDIIEK